MNKLLKSFLGIPIGIFVLEMVNLFVSLKEGQYFRIGGYDVNIIVSMYIACSVSSYLMMLYVLSIREIRDMIISPNEKYKKICLGIPNFSFAIIIVLFGLTLAFVEFIKISHLANILVYSAIAVIYSLAWTMTTLTIDEMIFLIAKFRIKKINKKLKEN